MAGEEIKNGSILVENGKIKEVVEGKLNMKNAEEINAKGLIQAPCTVNPP